MKGSCECIQILAFFPSLNLKEVKVMQDHCSILIYIAMCSLLTVVLFLLACGRELQLGSTVVIAYKSAAALLKLIELKFLFTS